MNFWQIRSSSEAHQVKQEVFFYYNRKNIKPNDTVTALSPYLARLVSSDGAQTTIHPSVLNLFNPLVHPKFRELAIQKGIVLDNDPTRTLTSCLVTNGACLTG